MSIVERPSTSTSGCSPRSSGSAPPRLRLPPSVGRLKPTADARNVWDLLGSVEVVCPVALLLINVTKTSNRVVCRGYRAVYFRWLGHRRPPQFHGLCTYASYAALDGRLLVRRMDTSQRYRKISTSASEKKWAGGAGCNLATYDLMGCAAIS